MGEVGQFSLLERSDAERDGSHRVGLNHEERPREVIPRFPEREHPHGDDRRPGERHRDREEDAQVAGPIDARRFDERVRERTEPLAHQEDSERVGDHRNDEALIGVDPAEVAHGQEQGHHDHFEGQDQGHDDRQEEHASAREPVLRQPVAREAGEQYVQEGDGRRDDDAIDRVPSKVRLGQWI